MFFALNQCNEDEVVVWKNNIILYWGNISRAFIQIDNKIFTWPETEHEALLFYLKNHDKVFANYILQKRKITENIKLNFYKRISIKKEIWELFENNKKVDIKKWSIWKFQINSKSKEIKITQKWSWLLYNSNFDFPKTSKILIEDFPDFLVYEE